MSRLNSQKYIEKLPGKINTFIIRPHINDSGTVTRGELYLGVLYVKGDLIGKRIRFKAEIID